MPRRSDFSFRRSRLRLWSKVLTPIFHDNCNTARKFIEKNESPAVFPANKLQLYSCREAPTKAYFSLFENETTEESNNEWMRDSLTKIIESGNHTHLIDNAISRAIGDDRMILSTDRVSHETRLREFIARQISGIGSVPKKTQATFCMAAAIVLAENLVPPAIWRELGPKICNEMGWSLKIVSKYKYLICVTARRFGKTRFISMTVVNFALSKPGAIVIIFSVSQDASNLLRQDVLNMLSEAGEVEFAGVMYNLNDLKGGGHKMMELRSPYNMDKISKIYYKPGLHTGNMDKQVCFSQFLSFEEKNNHEKYRGMSFNFQFMRGSKIGAFLLGDIKVRAIKTPALLPDNDEIGDFCFFVTGISKCASLDVGRESTFLFFSTTFFDLYCFDDISFSE